MTTDHRAEAERRLREARLCGDDSPEVDLQLRFAAVHATLADRCPDQAAHRDEPEASADVWEIPTIDEDDVRYNAFVQAHRLIAELRSELAEARAARPAPMLPEVVAVVEAAQRLWVEWSGKALSSRPRDLCTAVAALPEGWRDGAAPGSAARTWAYEFEEDHAEPVGVTSLLAPRGVLWRRRTDVEGDPAWYSERDPRDLHTWAAALHEAVVLREAHLGPAPAAVPAELDPAGVDRAARAYATPNAWGDIAPDVLDRRRAEAVVRAYLGDTDTGSEG